jgi:cytoplasmic iron level regulating protein YaaA (DUF328/UPF0246 family)
MKILLSSSKKQHFDTDFSMYTYNTADESVDYLFGETAYALMHQWQRVSIEDLKTRMKMSERLAEATFSQFQAMKMLVLNPEIAKRSMRPAIFAYSGEVYRAFNEHFAQYMPDQFNYLQKNVLVMSGLFGLLRPFDLIMPYRLEMKLTAMQWHDEVTHFLAECDEQTLNLASTESMLAVEAEKLRKNLYTVVFKEKKGDTYKIVAVHAKKARGIMADWCVRNGIEKIEDVQQFTEAGYVYEPEMSTPHTLIFVRK